MKLDSYEIRSAFADQDWHAILVALQKHFDATFPSYIFDKEVRAIYTGKAYRNAVMVLLPSPRRRYEWDAAEGFSFSTDLASWVITNPPVRMWVSY